MTDVPPPPPSNYGGAGTTRAAQPADQLLEEVVLENYAKFTGRSRRAEFWWYFLANLIISIVLEHHRRGARLGMRIRRDPQRHLRPGGAASPASPWASAGCTTPTRAAGGS